MKANTKIKSKSHYINYYICLSDFSIAMIEYSGQGDL